MKKKKVRYLDCSEYRVDICFCNFLFWYNFKFIEKLQKQYKEFPNTLYPGRVTNCFHFAPFIMPIVSLSVPTLLLYSLRLFHTLCPPISKYLSMHLPNSRTQWQRNDQTREMWHWYHTIVYSIVHIQILSIVPITSFITLLPPSWLHSRVK